MGVALNGMVSKGKSWKIPLDWMIQGYLYSKKPPYGYQMALAPNLCFSRCLCRIAQEGDGHSRRVGQRGRGVSHVFIPSGIHHHRKSGGKGTIHLSLKRVLSLVDGISVEPGSPQSVKLFCRLDLCSDLRNQMF